MGLRDLRKASGLKVKDICKRIGISTATWYSWETNSFDPKNSQLKVVSEVLGIPVQVLSDNIDEPATWPKKIDHTAYGLALLELSSVDELPEGGRATVILAKIDGRYHVRIFDMFGVTCVSMDLILSQGFINKIEASVIDNEYIVTTLCDMVGYQDLGYTRITLLMDTVSYELLDECRDRYEALGYYTNAEIEPRGKAIVVEKGVKLLHDELQSIKMEAC
jgi:transcriptional regulator with XRE-family HTH domain